MKKKIGAYIFIISIISMVTLIASGYFNNTSYTIPQTVRCVLSMIMWFGIGLTIGANENK